MFFADYVLLVEGPTEVALLRKLAGDGRIDISGSYVLDGLGKYNLPRFMNLLSALGVPHAVLYDTDGDKDEHSDLNQLIEDTRDPIFTIRTKPIHADIESLLGIEPAGAPHRKPQHVLLQYHQGSIAPEKLDEFAELVMSCCPKGVKIDEVAAARPAL